MDDSKLSIEQLSALSRAVPEDSERKELALYLKVTTLHTFPCIACYPAWHLHWHLLTMTFLRPLWRLCMIQYSLFPTVEDRTGFDVVLSLSHLIRSRASRALAGSEHRAPYYYF